MSIEALLAPAIGLLTGLVAAFVGWRVSRIGQAQQARAQAETNRTDREHNVFANTEQALTGLHLLNESLRAEVDRQSVDLTQLRGDFDDEKRQRDVDSAAAADRATLIGQRCLTQSTRTIRALKELGTIVVSPKALAMLARAEEDMRPLHPHDPVDPPYPL